MTDITNDPAASLRAVRQGRENLLAAVDCPPSRHFAFAALIGCYVAMPALALPARIAALALIVVSIALVVRWDKRRMGMFVSGYRAGRTRRVAAAMLAVVLPMYMLGNWLADEDGLRWPALAMAMPAAIFGYAMSGVWMRVFRREMLDER